jgi:hypothetical protein
MNKKIFFFTIAIVILIASLNFKITPANAAVTHKVYLPLVIGNGATKNQPVNASQSSTSARPAKLPQTISDPVILDAWVALYNLQQPIPLWNGTTLTGRQLAQYVLDRNIQISWSSPDACPNGNSCAPRPVCPNGQCPAGTQSNRVYITTELKKDAPDRAQRLLGTLAHELYHSTAPFGYVDTTQVEEFVAFYLSSQISPNNWTDFKGYDPLNPVCLRIWFRDHNLDYSSLAAYPGQLTASARLNESTCYTRTDSSKNLALVAVPVK